MSDRRFIIVVFIVLLCLNLFPLYQMGTSGGYLFYKNAFDESTYLQYDFSKAGQRISRISQCLVTTAHQVGLSGGWINFLFDIVFFLIFVIFIRKIIIQLKVDIKKANLYTYFCITIPLLFCGINPLIKHIFNINLSTGLISWLTVQEAWFMPLWRTPEPQFSLALMVVCIYFSLIKKSYVPAYLCAPFLYPFIAVPYIFVLIAINLRQKYLSQKNLFYTLAVSYLVLSISLAIYFRFFVNEQIKEILVASHLPLISFSSVLCLILYFGIDKKRITEQTKDIAVIISLAPLVASNHQIITGWIAQPNNFEQYFGVLCITFMFMIYISKERRIQNATIIISIAFMLSSCVAIFYDNYNLNSKITINKELLFVLKNDSRNILVNDVGVASMLNMVYPKQASTILGYENTFSLMAKNNFHEYVCAKNTINKNKDYKDKFKGVFATLDKAYKYENKDFILSHIGRKKEFKVENVPDNYVDCIDQKYFIFLVK